MVSGSWAPFQQREDLSEHDRWQLPSQGVMGQLHVPWLLFQASWPQHFYLIDLEITNLLDRYLETTEARGGKPFGQDHMLPSGRIWP